ncbi:hypothetical protein V8J82_21305 [Gymnodinialimonas sp. 2305UL16-5]|uniref:hypothetical protein n=1 Tax=Gymnodinialimonas mytili TaxID=3126503 RepID=UPI0030B657FE
MLANLLATGLGPQNRAIAETEIAALYGLELNTDRGRLAAELYFNAIEANRGGFS